MDTFFNLVGAAIAIAAYFAPTIVAANYRKRSILGIAALNILLGWTGVGWIVALVWAYRGSHNLTKLAAEAEPIPHDRLTSKLSQAVLANTSPKEIILAQLKGVADQAMLCTDKRVLILKVGSRTGQSFGSHVFQLPYQSITSVEVVRNLWTGYLELSAGGMQNRRMSFWALGRLNPTWAPNSISFVVRDSDKFIAASKLISANIGSPTKPVQADIQSAELSRLWELHKQGAINAEEYSAAKAHILNS